MTQAADLKDSVPTVGIIANPVSARDIRRIVANASNLQTAERVNIVLRLLSVLMETGVGRVVMMPDKAGLSAMLLRALKSRATQQQRFPQLAFVSMDVSSSVEDTFAATRAMQEAGVRAIIVLGGDGTHRAVVRELIEGGRRGLPMVPIAGLSTGTNNAFPEMREPTVTALAVGLYATARFAAGRGLAANKILEVAIDDGRRDIAIVDAVIASERYVGARALWKADSLSAAYLTFADPQAIGLSAIGGLLQPVGRGAAGGLMVRLADYANPCSLRLRAPIAPGLLADLGIAGFEAMPPDREFPVAQAAGVVALDGERELIFEAGQRVGITLREGAFQTVDVASCMHIAACDGLLRHSSANN